MSVDLVFVGSNGPNRLEGELVCAARRGDLLPAVLCAQHHPFALPQRERRDELPRDHPAPGGLNVVDRKSTRLNSSHGYISYAVFCLKKKKNQTALQHMSLIH